MQEENYTLTPNGDETYTLDVHEGVTTLGKVPNAQNVSRINVPASLVDFGKDLGWAYRKLKEINVHPQNKCFVFKDGALFNKDQTSIILCIPSKKDAVYTIPNTVQRVENNCFAQGDGFSRIDIGPQVTTLGNCSLAHDFIFSLEKIYIPPTAVNLIGEIFGQGASEGGEYYTVSFVGGECNSAIEYYCNQRGIPFVEVKPDEIENFYAMTNEQLKNLVKQQADMQTEYVVDELQKGYQAKYSNGTLAFYAVEGATLDKVEVSSVRVKVNEEKRKKITNVVIGKGITHLANHAFDDFTEIETVYIGPDVCQFSSEAFMGKEGYGSQSSEKIYDIVVDDANPYYKSVDGVVYTSDMSTLVKYSPSKPDLYYQVDSRTVSIGECAFSLLHNLQCLKIGDGCVSVENHAFINATSLRHVYLANSISKIDGYGPFLHFYGYERPWLSPELVVATDEGSYVYESLKDTASHVCEIKPDQLDDFLVTPLPSIEEDKYLNLCKSKMVISQYGDLLQVGDFGDELVLPEGVVRTSYRIDVSGCKKIVLPSTMEHFWVEGLDGPAPQLAQFVVNDHDFFTTEDGHLLTVTGIFLKYAPATNNPGVLPQTAFVLYTNAFSLLEKPIENLVLPKFCDDVGSQWTPNGWFSNVTVEAENQSYKAIDGSLYSIDGTTLVRAKVSPQGFAIAEGTTTIANAGLNDVRGEVYFPASVTEIKPGYLSGKTIVTPKGSFAEEYAKLNKIACKSILPNGQVEEYTPPKQNYVWEANGLPF